MAQPGSASALGAEGRRFESCRPDQFTQTIESFVLVMGANSMSARIFQPARNVMQSGKGKSDLWILQFTRDTPRTTDPLMGWTSASGTSSQIKMRFSSKQDAVDYAKRQGLSYTVAAANPVQKRKHRYYADNFKFGRTSNWTH